MAQTKKQSVLESITQTLIGLGTSILVQITIYPLMGIPVSFNQNLIITAVFFIVSLIRGYVVRRLFNKSKKECDHYFASISNGELLPCEFCGKTKY
jgi:hypothetical protein